MLKKILLLANVLLGATNLMQAASSSSTAATLTEMEQKAAVRMITHRIEYKDFNTNPRCQAHRYNARDVHRVCTDCDTVREKVTELNQLTTKCLNNWDPQPLTAGEIVTLRSVLDNTEEITQLKSSAPGTGEHEWDMLRAELPSIDEYDLCSHRKAPSACAEADCFEANVYKRHHALKKNISRLLGIPGAQGPDANEVQLLHQMTGGPSKATDRFVVKPARVLQLQALCERIIALYPTECQVQCHYIIPFYQEKHGTNLPENIVQNLDTLNKSFQVEYQVYLESLGKTINHPTKLSPQEVYIVEQIIQADNPTIAVAESPEIVAIDELLHNFPNHIHCTHPWPCNEPSCMSSQITLRYNALRNKLEFWRGGEDDAPKPTAEEEQLIAIMLRDNDPILTRAREINVWKEILEQLDRLPQQYCSHAYNTSECTEQNCAAKNITQRRTVLEKKIAHLMQEDGAEAPTAAEEAFLQQIIQETKDIVRLRSAEYKLWHGNQTEKEAVTKALEIHQVQLLQTLGSEIEAPGALLTPQETALVSEALKRFEQEIEADQTNLDPQDSHGNKTQSKKTTQLRGIVPAIGAAITLVAATKAYNIAYKQIAAECAAAQKKAEQEGLPLAPEMTQWQHRKAALKRTGHNIRTKLFKKHKLFAAGLTLLIGGAVYDFGPSL